MDRKNAHSMDSTFIYFKKADSGASVEGVGCRVCLSGFISADSICPSVCDGQWAHHVCGDPACLKSLSSSNATEAS